MKHTLIALLVVAVLMVSCSDSLDEEQTAVREGIPRLPLTQTPEHTPLKKQFRFSPGNEKTEIVKTPPKKDLLDEHFELVQTDDQKILITGVTPKSIHQLDHAIVKEVPSPVQPHNNGFSTPDVSDSGSDRIIPDSPPLVPKSDSPERPLVPKSDSPERLRKTSKWIKPVEPPQKKRSECLRLKSVQINETDLLSDDYREELNKTYHSKCITGKVIKTILSDLSTHFMTNNYVTTRPYLIPQNISSGVVRIKVITGVVENIVSADGSLSEWQIGSAFPFIKGGPLNIRELETALESINRVPSSDASFKLLPGKNTGGTIVSIENKETSPLRGTIGLTREGDDDNDTDLIAKVELDNLLNINDILTLSYNSSYVQKEYQGTNGYEINYSFPIGSYTTELVFSEIEYKQEVVGNNGRYLLEGKTNGTKLGLRKIVHRNQTGKLELKSSINKKDTRTYFEDELVDVSSYKTTVGQIDLVDILQFSNGQLLSSLSYYQGLDWLGARKDKDVVEDDYDETAKFQFQKWVMDLSAVIYLSIRNAWIFQTTFHGQYSEDVLHSNDQLRVGSSYSVRGYSERSLSGSSGWYLKNDLKKSFTPDWSTYVLKSITPYIGVDTGDVTCKSDNENTCGKASGFTVGMSTSGSLLTTEFTWSRPLVGIGDRFDYDPIFSYSMTMNF